MTSHDEPSSRPPTRAQLMAEVKQRRQVGKRLAEIAERALKGKALIPDTYVRNVLREWNNIEHARNDAPKRAPK